MPCLMQEFSGLYSLGSKIGVSWISASSPLLGLPFALTVAIPVCPRPRVHRSSRVPHPDPVLVVVRFSHFAGPVSVSSISLWPPLVRESLLLQLLVMRFPCPWVTTSFCTLAIGLIRFIPYESSVLLTLITISLAVLCLFCLFMAFS